MKINIPYNFKPRSYQLPFLKAMETKRRAVWIVHRRAGKDKTCWNFMINKAFQRVGTYFYLLPTYAQAKKIIWDGMDGSGFKFLDHIPPEVIASRNGTELKIMLKNGSVIQLVGTDNIDSLMGTNPIGCVFSEYSLQNPLAWDMMRPILAENKGWAVFNYTPRGKNHGYKLYEMARKDPDWFCELLTIKDTKREDGEPIITPEDIEQERREGMDEDLIHQEYMCSFNGAQQGSYYGKQMQELEEQGRIQKNLYDPILPVSTYWDLGMDDSMSITFIQEAGKEIRVIDYLEDNGEGLSYYSKVLREKPYTYDGFYFPHDAEVRELGTGKSRKEVAESLGLKPLTVVKRPQAKEDGIQAVRSILPRMYFDSEKCEKLIDALKSYSKDYDEKNKVFRNHPRHDWSSHAADSIQTFALGFKEKMNMTGFNLDWKFDTYGRPVLN